MSMPAAPDIPASSNMPAHAQSTDNTENITMDNEQSNTYNKGQEMNTDLQLHYNTHDALHDPDAAIPRSNSL